MKDRRLREATSHGVPDFPMQYYYLDDSHPRYEMTLHWHSEFEIVRVRSGTLELFVENNRQLLAEGAIAFIAGGQMHRAEPKNAVYECVVFDLNMLCRHGSGRITGYVLPLMQEGVELLPPTGEISHLLAAAAHELFSSLQGQAAYFELQAYSAAAKLIYLLYTGGCIILPDKGAHTGHKKAIISSLIAWIEKNYTDKLSLAALAAVAKTNEKYLCRLFREYTGSTPIEYVNRLRVERACLLLIREGVSVTEVAFGSGFNDTAYFCKIFKRYKGMTPRAYRAVVDSHAKPI